MTGNREEILREAEAETKDAEGANLEQANPDETLRQKDPAPEKTLENSLHGIPTV